MNISPLRIKDANDEREVAKFLDENLYSNINVFGNCTRTDELSEQIKGSDIIISLPQYVMYNIVVDEKSQTQYTKKPLNTFVLELSFLNRKYQPQIGWFLNDSYKTDYYLFSWPKTFDGIVKSENIYEMDYCLVSRKILKQYFIIDGWDKESLMYIDYYIRNNVENGVFAKGKTSDYWFYFSSKLAEKPINIVVKKRVLEALAIIKGTLKRK